MKNITVKDLVSKNKPQIENKTSKNNPIKQRKQNNSKRPKPRK